MVLLPQPPPYGIDASWRDRNYPHWKAAVLENIIAGLDLAKNVFQAHGPDTWSRVVFRKKAERRLGAAPDDGNDPLRWSDNLIAADFSDFYCPAANSGHNRRIMGGDYDLYPSAG